jgi:hypothetical protein
MNWNVIKSLLAILVFSFVLVSCDDENEDDMTEVSLYSRLGGTEMVDDPANPGTMIETGYLNLRSVVDSAIFVIAADPVLQPYFQSLLTEVGNGNLTGFSALSMSLTNFFAVATGAENYSYNGLNMVAAHDPTQNPRMNGRSDDAAFDAFVADVGTSLGQNGVTNQELINDLVALLETLREDVVQR